MLAELLGARDSVVTVETNLDLLPLFFTLPQWHGADVPTKITDRVQALGLVPDGCTLTNPAKSGAAAKNSTDCVYPLLFHVMVIWLADLHLNLTYPLEPVMVGGLILG